MIDKIFFSVRLQNEITANIIAITAKVTMKYTKGTT